MIVYPVLVAYRTGSWMPIAIESYLAHFPEDRLLVVDNNPQPGETGWSSALRRERRWLSSHPRVDLIDDRGTFPGILTRRSHGAGMDVALDWCRRRGADVLLHIEPDCLISGREWRAHLLRAIEQGAWMAGAHKKPWGPIHPTPSAWLVQEARTSFKVQPKAEDLNHPRFREFVDHEALKYQAHQEGSWDWARTNWDTADRAWFRAAVHDRAAFVPAPDFRHFWRGSTHLPLSRDELVERFPELAVWFARWRSKSEPRRVEHCFFRHDTQTRSGTEVACCKLLQLLSGVAESGLCVVRRDACDACCAFPQPSMSSINPVVASQVYHLSDQIVRRGGVEGCDVRSAAHLRYWAEEHLEMSLPGEGSSPMRRPTSDQCHYLGDEVGARIQPAVSGYDRLPVYECRHPSHSETTVAECRTCPDWTDQPVRDLVPIERLVPPPAERRGTLVRHWAVGVTTAPRPRPTLNSCLDSLVRSGWEEPRLFVDSAVTIADRFQDLPLTFHETQLGPWPNYYLALVELLMREPEADAFLLVQDDVIFDDRHNLREYLEEMLWPADPIAAVSLFCSTAYTRPRSGWHAFEGPWMWGRWHSFSRASPRNDSLPTRTSSNTGAIENAACFRSTSRSGAGRTSTGYPFISRLPASCSISATPARSGSGPTRAPRKPTCRLVLG